MTDNPDDRFVSYSEALTEVRHRVPLSEQVAETYLTHAIVEGQVDLRDKRNGKTIRFHDLLRSYGVSFQSVTVKSDWDVFAPLPNRGFAAPAVATSPLDRLKADGGIALNLGQALQAITSLTGTRFTVSPQKDSRTQKQVNRSRQRGRPPKADWNDMQFELIERMTNPENGKLARKDAIQFALDWCQENKIDVDSPNTVEPYVDDVLVRFERWVDRKFPS